MPKTYVVSPSAPGREDLYVEVYSNEINMWSDKLEQMINLTPEEALELMNVLEKVLRVKRTVYLNPSGSDEA